MDVPDQERIAVEARVSPRTVSRYIRGARVRPAIERAIREAARSLHLRLPAREAAQ